MLQQLKVAGLDPSLRNWGIAKGTFDTQSGELKIPFLDLIQPTVSTAKQIRQNNKDLSSAQQLFEGTMSAVKDCNFVFVEVPVGSQSARSMASYGICVGVLGALRASGIPFVELTPTEVKMASVGHKTATKDQIIQWATQAHPEANWPTYQRHGVTLITDAKAEHMADAIASIYAGIRTQEFQQYKRLLCKSI